MSKMVEFQKIGAVDYVDQFGDDDRVLVVTPEGVRQTTRGAVLGKLGGADIIEWDPNASRVPVGIQPKPFRRTFMVGGPAIDYMSEPQIDDVTKVITKKPAAEDGLDRASWTLNGSIPATGDHWLALHAECTDPSTVHRVYVGRHVVEEMVGSEPDDCYGVIEFTPTAIRVTRKDTGAVQQASVTYAEQKALLQITPTAITVFITGGFVFTMGVRGAEDLLIGGEIVSDAEDTQFLRINNVDINTAPRTPDAGFIPLSMEDSVLPVNAFPADILFTRSASVFRDQNLRVNSFYLLGTADSVVALVDERHVPTLAAHNRFAEALGFNENYVLASKENAVFLGKRTDTSYAAYNADRLTDSALYGKSFPLLGAGIYTDLYGFGSNFGSLTGGVDNVGVGRTGNSVLAGDGNVLVGSRVANDTQALEYVTAIGSWALDSTEAQVGYSVFVGLAAGADWTNPDSDLIQWNTAVGNQAMQDGLVGDGNTAIGDDAMRSTAANTTNTIEYNVAVGDCAMKNRSGYQHDNVAVGSRALADAGAVHSSVLVGDNAGRLMDSGSEGSVGIGAYALNNGQGALIDCTAVGRNAMTGLGTTSNSAALGANATVTGSNQVQLGNSITTTYVYGAVQSRSDERDKTGVRDTVLGLDFINALRPVDYQWDYREDYLDTGTAPTEPAALPAEPVMQEIAVNDPRYDSFYNAYLLAHTQWEQARKRREDLMEQYREDYADWVASHNLAGVKKDGSKRRSRYHHGFIAQEVKATAVDQGVDFGGYQDHSQNGGRDVRSLGYEEFIGPIVRSIQELDDKFGGVDLISQVTDRVLDQIANDPDNPLIDIIAERMLAKLAAARRG